MMESRQSAGFSRRTKQRVKKLAEPSMLTKQLFFPIDPKYVQLILNLLFLKYIFSVFYSLTIPFVQSVTEETYLLVLLGSFGLDIAFIYLLFVASREDIDYKQLSGRMRQLGKVLLAFSITSVVGGVIVVTTRTLWYGDISGDLHHDLLQALLVIVYISELLFFRLLKEQLVKATDAGQDIYGLSGSTRFLLAGFLVTMVLTFSLQWVTPIDPAEFYIVLTIVILCFVVVIDVWISGPNEYMNRESIHHLTNYTALFGLLFLISTPFYSPQTQTWGYLDTVLVFFLPLLLINLLSKYHGYLFRDTKYVQAATMKVDLED